MRTIAWGGWLAVVLLAAAYGLLAAADRGFPLHVYGYVGAIPLDCLAFATVGAPATG